LNALMSAARNGNEECVRVLIAAQADMAYADSYGMTALHYAVMKGNASICRVLVDEGASLTAENKDGKTPLALAKKELKAECVAIIEAAAAAMGGAV